MNLLESQWFFQMVTSQGKSPAERLVAVFKVTSGWISAPGIREMLMQEYAHESYMLHTHNLLKTFLTEMATLAKAKHPDVLTNQLLILLQGAITEELRNPEVHALEGATQAAQAVVSNSCGAHGRERLIHISVGALAASVVLAIVGWHNFLQPEGIRIFSTPHTPATAIVAHQISPHHHMLIGVNPDTINEVLVLQDRIDKGVCPAPQLLALPQGQMTAYMNVINFRTPENPEADQVNIRDFLAWFDKTRAVECYYRPSNGHINVAWVKR